MRFLPLVLGALGLSLLACGSSSESTGTIQAHLTKSCLRTECEALEDFFTDNCSSCTSACISVSSCDPDARCASSCGKHTPCLDSQKTSCDEEGFKLTVVLTADAALQASCEAMFDYLDVCQLEVESITRSICPSEAKTGGAGEKAFLDCVAKMPCTGQSTDCAPAPTTYGDELIAECTAKCPDVTYTDDERANMNANGALLTPAMLAMGKACVTDDACDDIGACLDAWNQL